LDFSNCTTLSIWSFKNEKQNNGNAIRIDLINILPAIESVFPFQVDNLDLIFSINGF